MSWGEFSGAVISVSDAITASDVSEGSTGFSGVGAFTTSTVNTSGFQLAPTVGSIVVLNFADVIQLTED